MRIGFSLWMRASNGRGTHAQLIQSGGWYAEQFERQQGESESADSGVKI